MNPSPIDIAPNSPILLYLLKEYYQNKKCLIKMNQNINKLFGNLNFIMNYNRINLKALTFFR